jgi:ornithine cyclodeaminase
VRVFSRGGANSFVAALAAQYPSIRFHAVDTPDAALADADVLVAATTSATPVLLATHVRRGVHINGIGSYTAEMQEVAAEVVAQCKIVVDSRVSALAEAGDVVIPIQTGLIRAEQIYAEIGEIAAGAKPGRETAEEITFFKSVGNAVQDAAIAGRIMIAAEKLGIGTEVAF